MPRQSIFRSTRSAKSSKPLRLSFHAASGKRYVPYVRKYVLAASRHLNLTLTELSIALVGDARMSSLHKEFMDIEGPTDVLTFPLELDKRNRVTAGEIVICVPEAVRQAKKRRTPVEPELLLYALHGMLHLCGFDDRTDKDFRQMHQMEDRILVQLGLDPVFGEVGA